MTTIDDKVIGIPSVSRVPANIRQTSGDDNGVVSGYNSEPEPSSLTIPSCTIEDVDRAMMALFDSTIPFQVRTRDGTLQKVPVVFAAGERFAQLQRNRPLRDKNNRFILPMIAIRRTSVDQTNADMAGRGINQHTGDLVIQRRLAEEDRDYQKLANRFGFKNQDGLATYGNEPDPIGMYVSSSLNQDQLGGSVSDDIDIREGRLLANKLNDNVVEFITVPQPQFYTAAYEVTMWAQYQLQMNDMLEILVTSQLPQGRAFKLNTEKGYWFVAEIDETKASHDNFENFAGDERLIKYSFTCKVPAYFFASSLPGQQMPLRRFLSAARISFSIDELVSEQVQDPDAGADDPTQPYTLSGEFKPRVQGEPVNQEKGYTAKSTEKSPFTSLSVERYVRVLQRNGRVGETVYAGEEIKNLGDV